MAASVCTLQFYDGIDNCYTLAFPILAAANVPGMAMVIPEKIGSSGKMTSDQLLEMQSDADVWDICYHGNNNNDLPALTDAELFQEAHGKRQLLVSLGFQAGARHAAPYSFHAHAREKRALLDAGFVSVYSDDADGVVSPSSTHTLLAIQSAHDAIDLGVVTAAIAAAAAAGNQICNLGFHDVVAAGPVGLEATTARVSAVIAAVAAAGLSVVTFSGLVAQAR